MALSNKGEIIITKGQSTKTLSPKTCKQTFESLVSDSSGRLANGQMFLDWILRKIRKLEITLPPCDATEVASVLSLVQGQEYQITYWDLITNAEKTISVYTSNSQGDCYSGVHMNGLYQDVTFSAIEIQGE